MNKLSNRHKFAGIEQSNSGIGVSTSARLFARKFYTGWGWSDMAKMTNTELNNILAQDFMRAEKKHQFKLKDGSIAQIKKSNQFYYIGKTRSDGNFDIIVIQSSFKPPIKRTK